MFKLIKLLLHNLDCNFIASMNAVGTKAAPYMAINYLKISDEFSDNH